MSVDDDCDDDGDDDDQADLVLVCDQGLLIDVCMQNYKSLCVEVMNPGYRP